MIYGCENSKFQTKEQYIANPIGCENHQPDWFLEQLKTPEGQEKLRIIIIDYANRTHYHIKRIELDHVLTDKERFNEIILARNCANELNWATQALESKNLQLPDPDVKFKWK